MSDTSMARCPRCGGCGHQRGHLHTRPCVVCHGTGRIPSDSPHFDR